MFTYISRYVHILFTLNIPLLIVNRLCGSGFETVCLGAEAIILGRSSIALCGGAENMSQTPLHIDGLTARWGAALGRGMKAEDALWAGLTDTYAKLPMGMTAENLAEMYGISRAQCDEYALSSQHRWGKANEAGIFNAEVRLCMCVALYVCIYVCCMLGNY